MKSLVTSALRRAGWTLATLALAAPLALSSGVAAIVKRAAGVQGTPDGLQGFVNAADTLITPAVVAMAAITPLACIVGAGAVMLGHRKGTLIIGAALGMLVFVASIKGIVA